MSSPPPTSTLFPYTTLFRSPIMQSAQHLADITSQILAFCPGRSPATQLVDLRAFFADREVTFRDLLLNRVELVIQCEGVDRKSTRLNSSHANISYAVFCLKK